MRRIDVVLAARVLLNLLIWFAEDPRSRVRERLRVELRIFDERFDMNVVGIGPGPPLDDMQRIAMRIGVLVDPDLLLFEADRIDDQRVAFPPAKLLAEERWIGIVGVLAVRVDRNEAVIAVPCLLYTSDAADEL